MIRQVIPVLHVASMKLAEQFYRRLGFEPHFAYRLDEAQTDPCYQGFHRDGVWLHVSSFSGDGVAGQAVNLIVEDVDAIHQELKAGGLARDLVPMDQTWGNRELYLEDPDGNSIRFVQEG